MDPMNDNIIINHCNELLNHIKTLRFLEKTTANKGNLAESLYCLGIIVLNTGNMNNIGIDILEEAHDLFTEIKDMKFEVNCKTDEIDSRTETFVTLAQDKMRKFAELVEGAGDAQEIK